jgi:hypothetical protein
MVSPSSVIDRQCTDARGRHLIADIVGAKACVPQAKLLAIDAAVLGFEGSAI